MNGLVVGVGTDLMHRNSLYAPYLTHDDPFLRATYSEREEAEALSHRDTYTFFELHFCCKEAVFKALGISGQHVKFNEIEILSDDNGCPHVLLHGALRRIASEKGIHDIIVSMSYDGDYLNSVAVAQGIQVERKSYNVKEDIFVQLEQQARSHPQKIAFPESDNDMIIKAAQEVVARKIGTPLLIGARKEVEAFASSIGVSTVGFEFFDHTDADLIAQLACDYVKLFDDMTENAVRRKATGSLNCAMLLAKVGLADCVAAGRKFTTADVFVAARRIIGMQDGCSIVSSLGILNVPGFDGPEGSLLAIADCAIIPSPDSNELADIAVTSADTVAALLGWEPRIAMLAFSTCGSSEHESLDVIREAIALVLQRRPELKIDGEFQLDAAIMPKSALSKVSRESTVAGKANILIFPNLHAGNIGVKLIQIFGKADAYGPVLQGFARPVCDFSRSAPLSEMMGNIIMLIVRAQKEYI